MNPTLGQVCNYSSLSGWRSLGLYERLKPINKWSVNNILYRAETAGDAAWRPLTSHHKMMWYEEKILPFLAGDEVVKFTCVIGWNRSLLLHVAYRLHCEMRAVMELFLKFRMNKIQTWALLLSLATNWGVGPPGLSKHNHTMVVNYVLSSRVNGEELKCAKENGSCL